MKKPTIVRGIVIPVNWNRMGRVTSVAIATYAEEKIQVTDDPAGRRLLRMLKRPVSVTGILLAQPPPLRIVVHQVRIEDETPPVWESPLAAPDRPESGRGAAAAGC